MSRLDPLIPLQVKTPLDFSIQNAQLSDLMSQTAERKAQTEYRKSETQKLKDESAKDQKAQQIVSQANGQLFDDKGQETPAANAIRSLDPIKYEPVIEQYRKQNAQSRIRKIITDNTDPTMDPNDPDYTHPLAKPKVMDQIMGIDPDMGNKIYDNFYKGLDNADKAAANQITRMKDVHSQITSIMNPSTITSPESFAAGKQAVAAKLQALGMSQMVPHFNTDIGDVYDPVETPKRLQQMHDEALTEQQKIEEQKQKTQDHKDAIADEGKWPEKVGQVMRTATTEPLWQVGLGKLHAMGVPDSYLSQIRLPGETPADAAARLAEEAITPEQAAKNKETENKPGDDLQTYLKAKAEAKGSPLTPQEKVSYTEKFKTLAGTTIFGLEKPYKDQALADKEAGRLDKSYALESKRIDTLAKPITDRFTRLQTIKDALDKNDPQADELLAPELLTAMAGGQGSGLRMNEAEISRIIGGRNAWENLKSMISRWQLNPKESFLIQPEQRKQMYDLISTAMARVKAKQAAIERARNILKDPNSDIDAHRQATYDLQTALDKDENGTNLNKAPKKGDKLNGYEFQGGDPNDQKNWKKVP